MNPLVSIIIPMYKVENYLSYCLDSVQSQSYKNLEIICINDGSPDRSSKIAEKYKNDDPRFLLINKSNGGLSDARNVGLDIASGDYIFFLDSDDCLDPNCIDILLDIALKHESQITSCEIAPFFDRNYCNTTKSTKALLEEYAHKIYELSYYNKNLRVSLNISCAKLYSKSLFEDIRFPIGKINEDECTTYQLYAKANKACHSFLPLYGYRQRSGSITHSNHSIETKLHLLDAYENRIEAFLPNKNIKLNSLTAEDYLCQISSFYFYASDAKLKKTLQDRYRLAFSKYKKYLPFTSRLKRSIFLICPKLYCTLIKLLEIL